MANPFNIEYQVNRRVHKFMLHKATEENIDPDLMRLVISSSVSGPSIRVFEQNRFVTNIPLRAFVEFFRWDYETAHAEALQAFLSKVSNDNNIALGNVLIVICKSGEKIGAHLYNATKYVRTISTVELLEAFSK